MVQNESTSKPKNIRKLVILLLCFLAATPFIAINTYSFVQQNRLRTQFANDFDYMLDFLEENFPLFGVIYRRNGVDMLELGRELRNYLAYDVERSIISHEFFWSLLRDEFFDRAFPVGHLRLVTDTERDSVLPYLGDFSPEFFAGASAGFGRFVYIYLTAPRYGFYREVPLHRPNAQLNPDIVLYTLILEEGRIAYLGVNGLQRHITAAHLSFIDSFYREIAGFEHLIIDIRGPAVDISISLTNL